MAIPAEDWVWAAATAEVPEGEVVAANAGGRPIALYKVQGEIFATDDECTHECVPLSDGYLDGCVIECPLHQGLFDIRTGKALCEPATEDVAVYPVKVVGPDVFVMLGAPASD